MNVLVLGAGIIGVSTAWHLLELGHAVTVVDRQPGAEDEDVHAPSVGRRGPEDEADLNFQRNHQFRL